MTEDEYDVFARATKSIVKRISAENTWLRHSLMEMEDRVEVMKEQLTHLEARAKVHMALRLTAAAEPKPSGSITCRTRANLGRTSTPTPKQVKPRSKQ